MEKAFLFRKIDEKQVKCLACSWYCNIGEGQTGVCGTRLNLGGVLYSLVYGKAVGLALDPVEKKPLYHFLPGCQLLSFGTVGCNFGCIFCQNWEQSQLIKKQKTINDKKTHIDRFSEIATPERIVELAREYKADGIAYTYNEPAIFAEFTHDTAVLAKKKGLKNVYVSNGFESKEQFEYIKGYIDAINIDLKSFRNEFYMRICKSKIEPVLENIKCFYESGIKTEVTTLLIPNNNDSNEELKDIAEFIALVSKDIPWHISAFHPDYLMQDAEPTSLSSLERAYKIGKKAGLKYVYVGNVRDIERSRTCCPGCGELLVSRDYYIGKVVGLDKKTGKCKKCGEVIYGVWN